MSIMNRETTLHPYKYDCISSFDHHTHDISHLFMLSLFSNRLSSLLGHNSSDERIVLILVGLVGSGKVVVAPLFNFAA